MRTAIITGGASEIGEAIAVEFAKHQYNLILTYFTNQNLCIDIARRIEREYGVLVKTFYCDLQKEESINEFFLKIHDMGQIEVLVNNAAVCYDALYCDKDKKHFMETLEVNVVGTFLMSKLVGEVFYQNRKGSIVNLASTNGMSQYYPMSIDYDASKAALLSLTSNLSVAYAPYVRVNAVAPGTIATKKELDGLDEEFLESEKDKISLHRFGLAYEVAKAVYYLASDDASYVNNSFLKVDGGMR